MRGDPQIIVSDHSTVGFKFGTKGTIAATHSRTPIPPPAVLDKFNGIGPNPAIIFLQLNGNVERSLPTSNKVLVPNNQVYRIDQGTL